MIVKEDCETAPRYVKRVEVVPFSFDHLVTSTFDRRKAKRYGSISEALCAQSFAEAWFPGTKWEIWEGRKMWAKGEDGAYGWRARK